LSQDLYGKEPLLERNKGFKPPLHLLSTLHVSHGMLAEVLTLACAADCVQDDDLKQVLAGEAFKIELLRSMSVYNIRVLASKKWHILKSALMKKTELPLLLLRHQTERLQVDELFVDVQRSGELILAEAGNSHVCA
jgi:hypothetical protein